VLRGDGEGVADHPLRADSLAHQLVPAGLIAVDLPGRDAQRGKRVIRLAASPSSQSLGQEHHAQGAQMAQKRASMWRHLIMVRRALEQSVGPADMQVLYDAPHNLMWEQPGDDGTVFLHRKGATPADGWAAMANTAYEHWGEPVIVPGSMGAPSYLLLGSGNEQALCSACHGAGRALSRGAAMQVADAELDAFLAAFRVVTPVDPKRADVRGRRDILEKWRQELKQEAPFAYKDITPVIDTLRAADVARPVAEFYPLMTVKG
jgi:tRNA-splicing ligase RtcB